MRILFIFPPKEHWALKQIELHKKIDEESGNYPPLGLLYVATFVLRNTNHEIEIIDAPTERMTFFQLESEIRQRKPDIVGIYFCTEYVYDSIKVAKIVKQVDKNIVVIAGGPHLFIYPKETITIPEIDYCIYGEGEIVFKDLIDAIQGNLDTNKITGVISKINKDGLPQLQKIDNLDSLPIPERKLIKHNIYKSFITYDNPITTMMTSRGCAFNCYYCNSIERGKKVRMRTPENVVGEIEEIVKLGIRDIIFFDENFTLDIKRIEGICEEIIRKKIKIRWHCRSRADMKFDEVILRKMKDAGCRLIQFGIETSSQRLQKVTNKNLDLEEVKQIIKLARDQGILVYGNFMLGLPTETKQEILNTIEFAKRLNLDYAPFSVFIPLPASKFYDDGVRNGIIKEDYWKKFVLNPERIITDYWWPEFEKKMLRDVNYYAFRNFYLRPKYILKALFRKQSYRQKLWQLKSAVRIFFG